MAEGIDTLAAALHGRPSSTSAIAHSIYKSKSRFPWLLCGKKRKREASRFPGVVLPSRYVQRAF